jgi:tryptophan-rich sensory protein
LFMSTTNVVSKNLLVPYISWLILALLLNVELVVRHH